MYLIPCKSGSAVFLSLVIAVLFSACQSGELESAMNQKQVLIYEVQISDVEKNKDWMKNIDTRFLVSDLFKRVEEGSLKAYHPFGDAREESEYQWTDILQKMDAVSDTMMVFNEETQTEELEIIPRKLELSEIKAFIFIEEWFLEKKTGKMVKNVLGIAPVRFEYFDESVHKSVVFVSYFSEYKPPLFESYY